MSFQSNLENLSDLNSYSLFGPNKPNPQGLLMISAHAPPLSDTINLIQPPVKQQQPIQTTVRPPSASSCDKKKLFVGNLPANTTLDELVELFGKYGRVNRHLSVVKDDNYAFVHFYNESDAELAQYELNDSFFKNRYIRVQYSISQGHIKKPKVCDLKKNPHLLSTSTSYSSLSSNENLAFKISQSQSVMSFNSLTLNDKQPGRAIKKSNSINKNIPSSASTYSLPISSSFEQQAYDQQSSSLNGLNQINLTSYLYFKNLFEQQQKLQQLQQIHQYQLQLKQQHVEPFTSNQMVHSTSRNQLVSNFSSSIDSIQANLNNMRLS